MYKSNFNKPLEMLRRCNEIAMSCGVATLAEQLDIDRAAADDAIVLGSTGSSTFNRVLNNIAEACSVALSELNDDNFAYIKANCNPVAHGDNEKFAFRFGGGYIVLTRNTRAFDTAHDCISDETTPLDLIVLSCAMKTSQRDRFMLVRYNDIGMMANPAFASGNYTAESTGRPVGDMWKMFDGMLLEMRSVVLDIEGMEIASLPFYKFRNLGECEGYSIERVADAIERAERVEITDKMDGSFVQMKWMGDKFADLFRDGRLTSMSGSLNPEANETVDFIYDWISEFEDAGMRYTDLCRDMEDWTFIFEFIRPDLDSHIVQYDEEKWGIYLLSARNIETGETKFYDELAELACKYNLPITKCFEGYDMDTVLDICHTADVSEREGFVVNIDGWYVKIKLDEFCAISKIVHGADNFNTIIANVARGTFDDLLGKVPMVYHAPLVELARRLYTFDEECREYVDEMVSRCPKDVEMKDVVAFFNGNVAKEFASMCIDSYKTGNGDWNFLRKNPRRETSTLYKEHEFEAKVAALAKAREAVGL